jgi:transposase-like protein
MSVDLTDPIFNDEAAAWAHFEAIRWPHGPVCPHCGLVNEADPINGKTARPGLYRCRAKECRKQFTATVNTVFESSHIPMHKWVLATHLLCSSKKGFSALQLHRNLGFGSYRTAWFMAHRIREALADVDPNANGGPLGGKDKVVEADETVVGGKAKNRAYREPAPKKMVATLVERGGRVRSKHVANIDAENLRPFIVKNASRKSTLNTDEASYYVKMGREFAGHHAVDHSRSEYAYKLDGRTVSTNSAENYFSIFKRGIYGVYHSVSEAHLHRYLAEFDFRYSNRSKLGIEDTERAELALKGVENKRLTYHQPVI